MLWTVPDASLGVVVGKHGKTILDTFPAHVAGPKVWWAVLHTSECIQVSKHIRDLRTRCHTHVCCIIGVLIELPITVAHAPSLRNVSIFIDRAV